MGRSFLFLFIVITVILYLNRDKLSSYFPIHIVKIYGVVHTPKDKIEAEVASYLQRGFFSIPMDEIHDHLIQSPWVSDVAIRRIWQDQLVITVMEKIPVARWGKMHLLSEQGVIFKPPSPYDASHLPLFLGETGDQVTMLKYFNEMNRLLAPLHVKIMTLTLSPYQTWKLVLDNGVILEMGHKDILTRLNHFVKVYPKIAEQKKVPLERVDLRYPNGCAIRWKQDYGKEANQ